MAGSGDDGHILGGKPVGHHNTLKAPLVTGCRLDEVMAVCGVQAIDQVVGGHDGKRLGLFDSNLKAFQVDLTERSLTHMVVGEHPVVFQVIGCEMLDRGAALAVFLYAEGHGSGAFSGNQRILGIILKVSSAERIPVNVQSRRQPEIHMELLHFFSYHVPNLLDELRIPGLSQLGSDGDGGTILIMVHSVCRDLALVESGNDISHSFSARKEFSLFGGLEMGLETKACGAVCQDQVFHAAALPDDG